MFIDGKWISKLDVEGLIEEFDESIEENKKLSAEKEKLEKENAMLKKELALSKNAAYLKQCSEYADAWVKLNLSAGEAERKYQIEIGQKEQEILSLKESISILQKRLASYGIDSEINGITGTIEIKPADTEKKKRDNKGRYISDMSSDEKKKRAYEMKSNGLSFTQVGKALGIDKNTAAKYAREYESTWKYKYHTHTNETV